MKRIESAVSNPKGNGYEIKIIFNDGTEEILRKSSKKQYKYVIEAKYFYYSKMFRKGKKIYMDNDTFSYKLTNSERPSLADYDIFNIIPIEQVLILN